MIRAARLIGALLILVAFASAASSLSRIQFEADGEVSDEEYKIYASAIEQFYITPAEKPVKLLMIEERTFRYDFTVQNEEPWREKYKGLTIDQSAIEDYETKNSKKCLLRKESFTLPVKHSLITDLDLKAIFHGNWGELEWINYYRRFPDSIGFVMVSRVGFNTDHTQALLYLGSRCGPFCGEIHFLLLQNANGTWTVKKELRKKSFG